MTITYLDSRRIQGVSLDRGYTTTTVFNQTPNGAETPVGNGTYIRNGVKILSGSSAIGAVVKKVSFSIRKYGTLTGSFYYRIRDANDNVLAEASSTANNLTTIHTTTELTLNNPVTLGAGYRILIEYTGDATNYISILYNNGVGTIPAGFNNTIYSTVWTDSTYNFNCKFDSTPTSTGILIANVQTNTLFEETDGGMIYWYDGNKWLPEYYFALRAGNVYVTNATYKFQYSTDTETSGTNLTNSINGACAFGTPTIGYMASGALSSGYTSVTNKYDYSNNAVTTTANTANYHGWGGGWSRPTTGYVVKGNSGGAYGTSVEKFSFSGQTYSAGTSMTQSSQNGTHQSTTIGYSTGRWAGASYGDTQKYQFSNDSISSGTNLTTATSINSSSTCSAFGLIAGGQTANGSGYQSRIEKYDHASDVVTTLSSSLTQAGTAEATGYGNTRNGYVFAISSGASSTLGNKISNSSLTVTAFTITTSSADHGSSTTSENEVMM